MQPFLRESRRASQLACIVALLIATAIGAPADSFAAPPPSPLPSAQVAFQTTPQAVQPATTPNLEQRLELIEDRLNLALALKDEKIQDTRDRIDNIYKELQWVLAIVGLFLAFFSIRDAIRHSKESNRQRGIDDIVKTAMTQQVRLGKIQVESAEKQSSQQFEPVQSVSNVIDVVQKTLAFRLDQDKNVADAFNEIKRIKVERERIRKLKIDAAIGILDHFANVSRMQYTALTDEQHKRGSKLVLLASELVVNELDEFIKERGFELAGRLFYTCGVIAYYDNDIVEARSFLDLAAQCRAADHDAEARTNEKYRLRFAFIHYYRALIQKNWGDLSEASHEIQQSARLLEGRQSEFLTPVTMAEIHSYITGEEHRSRNDLQDLLQRIVQLESGQTAQGRVLDANQKRLRNRMLVLLGNTHFMLQQYQEALVHYTAAIGHNADDYSALASVAQCFQALGDKAAATDHFGRCSDAIERSGDFRRKRERISRALVAVLAANAAKGCANSSRWYDYAREARDLLGGNLAVDGLSPKFFSPATKRLVSAQDLLKEV